MYDVNRTYFFALPKNCSYWAIKDLFYIRGQNVSCIIFLAFYFKVQYNKKKYISKNSTNVRLRKRAFWKFLESRNLSAILNMHILKWITDLLQTNM